MTALIVFGAKYLIGLVVAGAAGAVLLLPRERRRKLAYVALVALPLGYVLARVAGLFYSHTQPFDVLGFEPLVPREVDNSFPSDHVLLSGVLSSLAFLANRYAGVVLWALTLAIAASRVAAGVHWLADVAMGALLAIVAVIAAHRGLTFFRLY